MAPRLFGNMAAGDSVPAEISRRQFFQSLANAELITKEEAIAAMAGALPESITDIIERINDSQIEFDVQMMFIGASTFSRAHPYVGLFGAMRGMDDADLDALWRSAFKLY